MTGSISGAFKGILSGMESESTSDQQANLVSLAHSINESFMSTSIRTSLLASMTLVSIDLRSGNCCYLNAGHLPIFWKQTSGNVQPILQPGPLLGLNAEPNFHPLSFKLQKGESLFLHTDGLLENTGPDGAHITSRALKNILLTAKSSEEIKSCIVDRTKSLWKENPPRDDVAFLIVHLV